MTDPFGTAGIRQRVLDAWRATPARFREDANAEEDFAQTAYRDRLVVELTQNAVDAAAAAGVPARIRFVLTEGALYVANTGAPLSAEGVAALSRLRTSTKSAAEIGRFGVGFKAVLPLTDSPSVVSSAGAVAWSRDQSAELVGSIAELAGELERRGGVVPVMRLPFPGAADARALELQADGYDTVVVLPWRDESAAAFGAELVEGLDPTLALFLPGLTEIAVSSAGVNRVISVERAGERVLLDRSPWWVRESTGDVPAELLVDRPVEERGRVGWRVAWAFALAGDAPVPLAVGADARTVRAPQPTDDVLSVPALLSATLPLDTARRRITPGPLASFLLEQAAQAYAETLREAAPRPELLDLVPTGMPAGEADATLRAALMKRLVSTAWLPSASDESIRLRPREASVLDAGTASDDLTTALASAFPQLIPAAYARRHGALAALDVRRLDTADVVDLLATVDRPPAWWGRVYVALSDAPDRDALRALPVPLVDGRLAHGPRGLLLPTDDIELESLTALGFSLRVVEPDAAAGGAAVLLRALGAVDADAAALLDDPALEAAAAASLDDDPDTDPDVLADVVLHLAAHRPQVARERPWLSELALRDDEGELRPAGELLLPASAGGRLVDLVVADSPFGVVADDLVERYGTEALEAVGVLRTFATARAEDVPADSTGATHYLDGEGEWLASLDSGAGAAPPLVTELVAVRDLEWVDPERWGEALTELASPGLRAAVTEPVRVLRDDGSTVDGPSYTRWWLDNHPCVPVQSGGLAWPTQLRASDAELELTGLYDVVGPLSESAAELVAQLGALRSVGDIVAAGPDSLVDLLDRIGDAKREVERHQLRALYGRVCAALASIGDTHDLLAIESVRGVVRGAVVTAPPGDCVIVDMPDLLPLIGDRPVVPVPLALTAQAHDILEVPLATSLSSYAVRSQPLRTTRWGSVAGFTAAVARLDLVGHPFAALVEESSFEEHEVLSCEDADGALTQVAWRIVDGGAVVSRADYVQGLSRALATLLGRWADRHAIAAMLAYPDRASELLAEAELD